MNLGPQLRQLLTAIGTIFLICGALSAPVHAETVIKVGGTGSALGTIKLIAEAYEKSHPGTKIKVLPSLGSTAGIKAVVGGAIDLGAASRALTDSERQQKIVAVEYAKTPFVFIANHHSATKDLTTRELEGIYNNPEARWPDGARIRLILRPANDTDTKLISSLSPAMEQAVKTALARPGMIMAITDQEAVEQVERTLGALGGGSLCEIISEKPAVTLLSLNGVKPSVKTLTDKSYPLVKSLYLITTPKTSAAARAFAEFIQSPTAAKILKDNGNMPVKVR
jgi:phosphate transport system substrate-binding protein